MNDDDYSADFSDAHVEDDGGQVQDGCMAQSDMAAATSTVQAADAALDNIADAGAKHISDEVIQHVKKSVEETLHASMQVAVEKAVQHAVRKALADSLAQATQQAVQETLAKGVEALQAAVARAEASMGHVAVKMGQRTSKAVNTAVQATVQRLAGMDAELHAQLQAELAQAAQAALKSQAVHGGHKGRRPAWSSAAHGASSPGGPTGTQARVRHQLAHGAQHMAADSSEQQVYALQGAYASARRMHDAGPGKEAEAAPTPALNTTSANQAQRTGAGKPGVNLHLDLSSLQGAGADSRASSGSPSPRDAPWRSKSLLSRPTSPTKLGHPSSPGSTCSSTRAESPRALTRLATLGRFAGTLLYDEPLVLDESEEAMEHQAEDKQAKGASSTQGATNQDVSTQEAVQQLAAAPSRVTRMTQSLKYNNPAVRHHNPITDDTSWMSAKKVSPPAPSMRYAAHLPLPARWQRSLVTNEDAWVVTAAL